MQKLVKPIAILMAFGLVAALALTAVSAHEVRQVAKLSGAKEVPGPGDPDGTGKAVIRANEETKKVCYRITFTEITDPFAGHIHKGKKDESGDVVVTLFDGEKSSPIRGCVKDVSRKLINRIHANPQNFYVNLHNADYEAGAIRGQLRTP